MRDTVLAKEMLNGVWEGDVMKVRCAILDGADPNWIFNGYPILIHAVYTQNLEMVEMLIDNGASQCSEALGFALEYGLGDMVFPLFEQGIVPKECPTRNEFGDYPCRFAPMSLEYHR